MSKLHKKMKTHSHKQKNTGIDTGVSLKS